MNLNQVTLPAKNVELSALFYRRLGFTQIVSALPRYARFECQDGATFSLHAFDTVVPSQTVVYFECNLSTTARHRHRVQSGAQGPNLALERSLPAGS